MKSNRIEVPLFCEVFSLAQASFVLFGDLLISALVFSHCLRMKVEV